MPRRLSQLLLAAVVAVPVMIALSRQGRETPRTQVPEVAVGAVPDSLAGPLPENTVADSLVIQKARRQMHLYSGGRLAHTYWVALGPNPVGHKRQQGDGRTPEGRYSINGRNPGSAFHLSLRVSYPRAVDVENARRHGVSPGGDIFIHGTPGTSGEGRGSRPGHDWTLGCIAVTNDEIEELWDAVPNGTPVVIRP